jgi:hypothetical protein
VKYRSEGKDKREESKQSIDGGAHETCRGEDERATDRRLVAEVIFPSPSPSSSSSLSSSPSASPSPRSPSSLPLFLAPFAFAFASTPTDLRVVPVRSLPLVSPPFVPFHRLRSCILALFWV